MDVSQFLGGSLFSQTDLGANPWQLMTITNVDQQMVGQGQTAEQKICLHFSESAKPLGLNRTNLRRVAELFGTQSTAWIGQQLLVYRSTTSFQGKAMLCVRLCGAQQAPPDPICDQQGNAVGYQPAAPAAAPAPSPAPAAPAPATQQPVAAPGTDDSPFAG